MVILYLPSPFDSQKYAKVYKKPHNSQRDNKFPNKAIRVVYTVRYLEKLVTETRGSKYGN